MYWPVLDERLGRRMREHVERAFIADRGVWAIAAGACVLIFVTEVCRLRGSVIGREEQGAGRTEDQAAQHDKEFAGERFRRQLG